MSDSEKRSTHFVPIIWEASGHMLLLDGDKQYWYSRVQDWKYKKIKGLCKRGLKGRVYQYLLKHCKFEFRVGAPPKEE